MSRQGYAAADGIFLVVPERHDRETEGRFHQATEEECRQQKDRQRDVVIAQLAIAGELVVADLQRRQEHHAHRAASDLGLTDDQMQDQLAKGEGHQDDVNAFQSEHRQTDQRGGGGGEAGRRDRQPRRNAEHLGDNGAEVDTDAEERQMREIEDAAIAKTEIPVRGDDGVDHRDNHQMPQIRVADDQRQQHQGGGPGDLAHGRAIQALAHRRPHFLPNRPVGRITRTPIITANKTAGVQYRPITNTLTASSADQVGRADGPGETAQAAEDRDDHRLEHRFTAHHRRDEADRSEENAGETGEPRRHAERQGIEQRDIHTGEQRRVAVLGHRADRPAGAAHLEK